LKLNQSKNLTISLKRTVRVLNFLQYLQICIHFKKIVYDPSPFIFSKKSKEGSSKIWRPRLVTVSNSWTFRITLEFAVTSTDFYLLSYSRGINFADTFTWTKIISVRGSIPFFRLFSQPIKATQKRIMWYALMIVVL